MLARFSVRIHSEIRPQNAARCGCYIHKAAKNQCTFCDRVTVPHHSTLLHSIIPMTSHTTRSRRAAANYHHEQHSSWTQFMFRGIFPQPTRNYITVTFSVYQILCIKFMTARLFILVCTNWQCIVLPLDVLWLCFDILFASRCHATSSVVRDCMWPTVIPLFLPFTFSSYVYNLQSWKPRLFHCSVTHNTSKLNCLGLTFNEESFMSKSNLNYFNLF